MSATVWFAATVAASTLTPPAAAVVAGVDYAVTAATAVPQIAGAAIDVATRRVFAAGFSDDAVFVVDADTHAVLNRIPVGTAPTAVAVNQRTDTVYVVNQADSTVSVIDARTQTVTATLRAGVHPSQVIVDEAANTFIVRSSGLPAYHGAGAPPAVLVFDAATNTISRQTDFETLGALAFDPGRSALYVTVGAEVREYDQTAGIERRVVAAVPGAANVAVDASTHDLYVTTADSRIAVLDPEGGTARATILLPDSGGAGYQIDLDATAGRLFAVSRAHDAVFVVSLATSTIVQALDLGTAGPPDRVFVDPSSHVVYVSAAGPGVLATLTRGSASGQPEPTVTTVAVTPADVVAGARVTATATVVPPPGGGTVGFLVDGRPVTGCTARPVDGAGRATCTLGAQTVAGTHTAGAVFAATPGFAASSGSAPVHVRAGSPTRLHLVSGNNQSEHANGGFERPLSAIVLDAYGNAVANALIRFTVTPPLATFGTDSGPSATVTVRSQDGGRVTSPSLQAGPDGGTFTVTAAVVGAPSGGGLSFAGTVTPVAYVGIRLTVPAQAHPGSSILARVTLVNDGPSAAGWLLVGVAVPTGLACTSSAVGYQDGNTVYFPLFGVVAGARPSAAITCLVPTSRRGTLTWIAAVTSGTPDPRPQDNLAAASAVVVG